VSDWNAVCFAAKQPRGNKLWQRIVDKMFKEIAQYLELRDMMSGKE